MLADNDDLMLKLLFTLLSPHYEVVARVNHGEDALAVVDSLKPNALVTDIVMPGLNGIEIAQRLRQWESPTQVVLLAYVGNGDAVKEALAAGVRGFVLKKQIFRDLPFAVSEVLAGRTFVSKNE